jgi:hypothetical protein
MSDKLKNLLAFGGISSLLFIACQRTDTTPADQVSISVNQSARVGADVVVRADSIQDSRCPVNVTCVWAGQAKVKLELSKGNDNQTLRLILDGGGVRNTPNRADSTQVSLAGQNYKVILREVNPYPGTGPVGQPQTAIVQVTPL